MNYGRQDVRINTKITDKETLIRMVKPICDFADKHNAPFDLAYSSDGSLVATYEIEGKTSSYCKGVLAEIKQMLKDTFNCKIDVLLYAY